MHKFVVFCLYVLLVILVAGLFGSVHDQISYTVAPEYFTRMRFFQFRMLDESVPERIRAAQIGFMGSWWLGVPIGLLAGAAGFIHPTSRQMRTALVLSIPVLLASTLLFSLGGLMYGYLQSIHIDPLAYPKFFVPDDVMELRRFWCAQYMHQGTLVGAAWAVPISWLFHALWKSRAEHARFVAEQGA